MSCDHHNLDQARYCVTCGVSLERLLCRCGTVQSKKNNYCLNCGLSTHLLLNDKNAIAVVSDVEDNKLSLMEIISLVKDNPVFIGTSESKLSQQAIGSIFKKVQSSDENNS